MSGANVPTAIGRCDLSAARRRTVTGSEAVSGGRYDIDTVTAAAVAV